MNSRPARLGAARTRRRAFLAAAFACALAAPAVASTLAPAAHLALRLEADSLFAAGANEPAAAAYERLLAADSTDAEARWKIAQAYFRLGRMDDAIPHGLRALAVGFADREGTLYEVAKWHAAAGRKDEALEWLGRAVAAPLLDRPDLKTDEAFAGLRDDPRFRALAGFGSVSDSTDRVTGWRADLAFFVAEARRLHASPARRVHDPGFPAAVEALAARVPSLDDTAVALELQKIVVTWLADGHSAVFPIPTPRVAFSILPVRPWFFADGLYVIDATPEWKRLVGRRITAIGGKKVDTIRADLAPYVARDNDQGIVAMGTLYLRVPAVLRAMGYAADPSRVEFTVVDEKGATETVTVTPGGHDLPHGLVGAPGVPAPGYLARTGETAWFEARPELGAVYVQFNQVRAPRGGTLGAFAAQVRDEIRKTGAKTLVLDVRHNRGGNNFLIWPLVRLAAWHETEGPGRKTFVITGRATFSAAQNLVNQLDRSTNAIFVGEAAGSRPNFTGEDTSVELPWSKLRLSISARYWQDSYPMDERPYVQVAMPVEPTAADWRAGRDPVMEGLAQYLARR